MKDGPAMGDRVRQRFLFAALYFAEGAPIGFIWWALPVWLRTDGLEPGEIARIMATVTWPWTLKFLWAPVVDLARGRGFGSRAWILVSQAVMAIALVPLLVLDEVSTDTLVLVLLAHGMAAATQDAAIDSLAIRSVPVAERGAINGWMQVGMLGARALFGGGAVLLAARTSEDTVVVLLVLAILLPGWFAWRNAPPDDDLGAPRRERFAAYAAAFRGMLRQRVLWIGLFFASTAGAGFEGLASLAGPLLLDRGASEDSVGFFFLIPTVTAMALGAIAGGRLSDRMVGRRAATALGVGLAALCVLAVGLTAWFLPEEYGSTPFMVLLTLVYFAAGMATASLYALLMEVSDRAVAATQFCVFMAGINLCYVWSTRALGALIDRFEYGPAITILACVSLAVLPFLAFLRPTPSSAPSSSRSPGPR